jgi:hypothetical protein
MTKMSSHDKKPPRGQGQSARLPSTTKSPITTPAPARIHNRFKETSHPTLSDSASAQSGAEEDIDDVLPSSADREKDKEKDDKIKELARELQTMADEFERELTGLLEKLTAEKETSQFWQHKHSSLNQTYLKADTDLRLLRQELSTYENRKEDKERDIKTRISSLMLDRDAFREAYNEAMGELRGKEEEVARLRESVRGLKSWVSLSGRSEEQVTDESVGEGGRRLGNGVQNWCVAHFRRVKIGKLIFISLLSVGARRSPVSVVSRVDFAMQRSCRGCVFNMHLPCFLTTIGHWPRLAIIICPHLPPGALEAQVMSRCEQFLVLRICCMSEPKSGPPWTTQSKAREICGCCLLILLVNPSYPPEVSLQIASNFLEWLNKT